MDRPIGLFALANGLEFSSNDAISPHLTLRRLCERYRDAEGRGWSGNGNVPELDGAVEDGQMCRLRGYNNIVGYPCDGIMLGYEFTEHSNLSAMQDALVEHLSVAIETGMLWCPPLLASYERIGDRWRCNDHALPPEISSAVDAIASNTSPALSAYSCQAFYEAQRTVHHSPLREFFIYGSQVTPVTGLFGTAHNNMSIDMYVEEDPNVPDLEAREFRSEFLGIICAGHTAHSQDAGIARRVDRDVDVRLLTAHTLDALRLCLANTPQDGPRDWLVFCMGQVCWVTAYTARAVWETATHCAHTDISPISAYYIESNKILYVTICSGTLLRWIDGAFYDSNMLHRNVRPSDANAPNIDVYGDEQLDHCFSLYFGFIPYVRSDRPPRPLMASVQTQQAVCTPWSPGTAAVAPCYSSRPLVRTKLVDDIITNIGDNVSSIADEIPGFDVCICFANIPENYEDAMVVSQKFVDMGGFSSTAICSYLLPPGEYVPPAGHALCSKVCRWWKSTCPTHCEHKKPGASDTPRRRVSIDRNPTGTVLSSRVTSSGEISVTVLSFSPLQTGDKISAGHGQKGVTNIMSPEDMPYGMTSDGCTVHFDVIMAISSVTNRQTNGQVYEAVSGLEAARTGKTVLCEDGKPCIDEEITLVDGVTGMPMVVVLDDGIVRVSSATFGYTRMFSQTQMVRDRHHATHFVPGPLSVTAPTGRSRGGPVRLGEMEVKAMVSAGLVSCVKELMSRSDMVTCDVCSICKRLGMLCQCDVGPTPVSVTMPYGTVVFDLTTAAAEGWSLEYELSVGE
ncbi:hypothetical protein BJX65DRAFT_291230 [Aspergillus insuetus]